jgi:hypothetical protein
MFSVSFAQIKMEANGDIVFGEHYNQPLIQEVDIRHRLFVRQVPRNGTPGYSYTGAGFVTYTNGAFQDPIMEPQWSNTYWLGRPGFQFWRVYSNQVYANGVLITSDARLKTNFSPLENSLNRILKLEPFTYDFAFTPDEKVSESINKRVEEAGKNQIGFKAQDMQKDFPNLVVYDQENDQYAVNYIGLIPEMVAAMQEQNQVIEELREELTTIKGNCCTSTSPNTLNAESNSREDATSKSDQSLLQQNEPNPFHQETVINYYLAEQANQASIYIYNMNGKQLERFALQEKGNQSLTIQKNRLRAGMYYYSLIVDGEEIATKKMILTD